MKKHGVIMVFLLILALCSISIVSANENVTTSSDGTQKSLEQGSTPVENIENNESGNVNVPSKSCSNYPNNQINYENNEPPKVNVPSNLYLSYSDNEINYEPEEPQNINVPSSSYYDSDDGINYKLNTDGLSDFSSIRGLPCLNAIDSRESLDVFELAEINDKTEKNVLNKIKNSPDGYVTHSNGNLLMLPLTKTDLNAENKESLLIRFNENKTETLQIFGNDGLTDDSWSNPQINEVISGITSPLRLLSTGVSDEEKNYPQNDLPLDNAQKNIVGVSRDFDADAFIWSEKPDKRALVIVDMVNKTTDGVLKLNLNEKQEDLKTLTSNEIKEIGVNASLIALDYFKSQGINIQKGYPYLYVLTSASEVKINETSTDEAIDGISEVLGLELNKNIFPIHNPLWKDLIFYYIWVNSANNKDMSSYALKYDANTSKLIVSEKIKKQGDLIAYKMGLYEKYFPVPKPHCNRGTVVVNKINTVNLDNNTADVNNTTSTGYKIKKNLENSIAYSGNPFNVLYTLIAILIVSAIFGVGYSRRD